MVERVLILGGSGRIGRQVAADLVAHTTVEMTITGRHPGGGPRSPSGLGDRVQFQLLDLGDPAALQTAIRAHDLVIHCAGPFHYRDVSVLEACIQHQVNYIDVSDHPAFTRQALACQAAAATAGITAVVNTGIFPGISNSLVRQGIEQLDTAESVHLSYIVAGSGGAGVTVMRTTFLGLQQPFLAWIGGQWQAIQPYSDREVIEFPPPYGKVGVYWFDMPEAFTLPATFPVQTVITKFATVPRFYNYLTWSVARWWHPRLLKMTAVIEFLSYVSHFMTDVTDRFSGVGVAMRSEVTGTKAGQPMRCCSTLVHPDTATAAGIGTGTIAELMLSGQLHKPGVWAVEQALSTDLFATAMRSRGIAIQIEVQPQELQVK
jgi:saccharopine dehydrogenase-like NADP-dependent oxidoreductase